MSDNFSQCTNSGPPDLHPLFISTDVPAELYNRMIEQNDSDHGSYKESFVLVTQPDAEIRIGLQKKDDDLVSELKDSSIDELGQMSERLFGDYGLDKRSGRINDRLFIIIDEQCVRDDGHTVRIVQWQSELVIPGERHPPPHWSTARVEWDMALQWLASIQYGSIPLDEVKEEKGDDDVLQF